MVSGWREKYEWILWKRYANRITVKYKTLNINLSWKLKNILDSSKFWIIFQALILIQILENITKDNFFRYKGRILGDQESFLI